MENIMKEKLATMINKLSTETLNEDELKETILNSFPDAYITEENINQAYYESKVTQIYLKNSNGLYFEIESGNGDIFGNLKSRQGIGVRLVNGITEKQILLFDQGVMQLINVNSNDLNKVNSESLFDVDKVSNSSASINLAKNGLLLYTLDNIRYIEDNQTLMNNILEGIWNKAVRLSKDEMDYSLISPYDGLDSNVRKPSSHYLVILDQFKSFPALFSKGEQYLLTKDESKIFLEEAIAQAKREMLYVDYKEVYSEIWNIEMNHDFSSDELEKTEKILNITKLNLNNERNKLLNIENDIEGLKSKKYSLLDQFMKMPIKEKNAIEEEMGLLKLNVLCLNDKYQDCLSVYDEMLVDQINENKRNDLIDSLPFPKSKYDSCPTDGIDYDFDKSMEYYVSRNSSNRQTVERYEDLLAKTDSVFPLLSNSQDSELFENKSTVINCMKFQKAR